MDRNLASISGSIGQQVRRVRLERRLTQRELALAAGLARSTVADVEAGEPRSVEIYARIAEALRLRLEMDLVDPRRRDRSGAKQVDLVHAAMGEIEARHLRGLGVNVSLDEPYQHYQFAGRGDVIGCKTVDLLQIENRTEFQDLQDTYGSFNSKRAYLGVELASRLGVKRWRSETHVIVALWSAEVLRTIRAHRASFESVCPDPLDVFEAWWSGRPIAPGRHSALAIFDPLEGRRSDRRRYVGLADLDDLRPRYRDYAEAAAAILASRRSTSPR